MQVAAIKPTVKAPGIKLLKLKCDERLSNFAFKFNLRRYTMDQSALARADAMNADMVFVLGNLSVLDSGTHAEVGPSTLNPKP